MMVFIFFRPVIYLDWRRFRLAVALQLDLDLDCFINAGVAWIKAHGAPGAL